MPLLQEKRVLKHAPGVLKCSPVGNQDGWHYEVELKMMSIVKLSRWIKMLG